MKTRVLLGILLFLVGIQTPWAAGPGLPQLLSGTAGQQQERSIDVVPDPAVLRGDWWLYFNVPESGLAARSAKLTRLLDRYSASDLDADDVRGALVSRVISNLDAYVAARQVEVPATPALPDASEIYTPGQALELVSSLRNARQALLFDLNDVAALKEAVASSRQDNDAAMAAYLQLDAIHPRRVAMGLDLIAERLALATSGIQLKLRQAALNARQARVDALGAVEQRAERRLRGDAAEAAALKDELKAARLARELADKALSNEKRRMLLSTADTVQDHQTARFRQQRVTRASIEQLDKQIEVRRIELQSTLNELLLAPGNASLAGAHQELELTRSLVADARARAATLETGSELERDRAGEQLAGKPDTLDEAQLTNQRRLRLAQDSIGQLRVVQDRLTQLEFLSRWSATAIRSEEGLFDRVLSQASDAGSRIGHSLGAVADRSLFRLGETPITLSGLFKVIVVILIAWLVSWIFRRMIGQLGHRFPKENQSLLFIITRLAHYLIMMIGVIAGLSSIGLSFANFALVAGALALGVGFGLQTIVNNFLSGLILFFERTVKVGDFVLLDNGERGEVRSINVRGTIINTNDNLDVIVPNSEFTERKVVNWTLLDSFRRIHVPFRVAYSADEDKVVEAGLEAAHRLSSTLTGVLGREPSVWLVNYGENGLDFELIVWLMPDAVKRPDAISAAYHWEIRKALRRHDIEVPVPQREIRFRQPLPPGLDASLPPSP